MAQDNVTYIEPVHESIAVLILRTIFLQLILAVAAALVIALYTTSIDTTSGSGFLQLALDATIIALLITDSIFVAGLVVQWSHRRYIITPEEIVVDGGLLHIERRIYKTSEIESVELRQSTLGKLFNYGTIAFYSKLYREGVQLTNLPNPHRYMQLLAKEPVIR